MTNILSDHNIEGQTIILWGALAADGWLDLLSIKLVTFEEAGLPFKSSDRKVWRFAQAKRLILLTDNRNMKGKDSLEQTIREENTSTSLPVLTIGNTGRLDDKEYRRRCATRLAEVVIYRDRYLGVGRVFIP
jgi:hypothetical protein